MPQSARQTAARVYLVGGGPGDPRLITLRAVECLRRADAVVYDYLVNPRVLAHAGQDAELICLGRHGLGQPDRGRIMSQAEINATLIDLARGGKTVVRLKGGDPAIFGHLAEEATALADAGIEFEIVPGVTAASAAASYAGIPLTHRDSASAVAFVAGHQRGDATAVDLDAKALAAFPGTLVVYMGVTTAATWTRELIAAGKPPDTPAAIVRRVSLPDQQRWICRLDEVAARLAAGPVRPPVLVIVGDVVGDVGGRDAALDWFMRRPLFGRTVLVTRPASQAEDLTAALLELGADVLVQPAIEISAPDDAAAVDRIIDRLAEFEWLVFSSANGVRYFLERVLENRDLRALGGVRLAAIGPGTAEALAQFHLRPDMLPDTYRAEALAEALAPLVAGRRVLLVRASRGREVLAKQITKSGGIVEQVVAYRSIDVAAADGEVIAAIKAGRIDWITVTSSAIARSLVNMFGERLHSCRLASISPLTTETLGGLGFAVAAEAAEYTMDGVVAAIAAAEATLPKRAEE
ncbi:MAG: uroporphyrinogen-III C-methyltransferase [Pirellulales bacterium]